MQKTKYEIEKSEVVNTFIITTYHGEFIMRCLTTLCETIDRTHHRIILIESPNKQNNPILYEQVKPYIDVYVKTERNYGFDQSVNLGIMMSRSPYFTVVHDDTWFIHKGWWEEVESEMRKDENLLVTQPNQRFRREENPIPVNPTEEEYIKILSEANAGSLSELYCMIFKREFVDKVGYFNERIYPLGPEDIELFYRISSMGYRMSLSKAAVVYHDGAGTSRAKVNPRYDFEIKNHIDKKKLIVGEYETPLIKQL